MMLTVLADAAVRAFMLGGAVWLGLYLFRVTNPNAHMTAWVVVLLASLSMPLMMRWTTVTITVHALVAPAMQPMMPEDWAAPETLVVPTAPEVALSAVVPSHRIPIDGWMIATVAYLAIGGLMLTRLLLGLNLAWRLVRDSLPIQENWTGDWDVRLSRKINGPVTVGSVILVPPDVTSWDETKRQAVLAHEAAHVAHRDFYLLLLASLNRILFWFSPFAWWQLSRLSELAETISDDRAIEALSDRVSYAEVLLELVQGPQTQPVGLQMARACTVPSRIEIILAAATLPAKLGWRKQLCIAAAVAPLAVISAGSIAYRTLPDAASGTESTTSTVAADHLPQSVEFYAVGAETVFAISHDGDDLYGQVTGGRRLRLSTLQDGSYSYSAASGEITFAIAKPSPSDLTLRRFGRNEHAIRIAALPGTSGAAPLANVDQYVGWYALPGNRVLAVTRDDNQLRVQETGRPTFVATNKGGDAFTGDSGDAVIFLRDADHQITRVLLQDDLIGGRFATPVDEARAKAIEAAFARQAAEVADRFTEQAPAPGSKEIVLRGISDLQRGAPDYDRMTPGLAAKIRRQADQVRTTLNAFGAVEQVFFRGVGPGGYDIYGIKFAKGSAEIRLSLTADGKAADSLFRADGNDEPGEVVACSREAGLKAASENIPINMMLFNSTGNDIHIYDLDRQGRRVEHGTIADNMSSSVLTSVGNPWVVTDRSGQCLQIVLPGEHTRGLVVETSAAFGVPLRATSARSAPQAGSEEALRQYILAVGQGQPDYDHMTPAVAAWTRGQLPFSQAILGKLGPLRSLSFRAVSGLGSDIYMARFANGTAEWRIGLTRNGTIGRIALGPQY